MATGRGLLGPAAPRMMRFLHQYAEHHPDFTRKVLTRAATFRARRLIVYVTPGFEFRSGGILAIAAYYRESLALRHIHGARVVLCTVPGDPPILKYRWFENHNYILDLESVLKYCSNLQHLLIHIPAHFVDSVVDWLAVASPVLLRKIEQIHLNILLMNIDNIQGKNVSGLKRFGRVTCTTAHEAYTNVGTREALKIPLHRLSCRIGPEDYSVSSYREKEPLLIVSPDPHPFRDQVIDRIARTCPSLTIRVIHSLTYDEYFKLASRTKWSLTFGEGLDGYFVEPVLSGGVSFAVFNKSYFTPAFAQLKTMYPSWDVLMERMPVDLGRLDEPLAYERCWRATYDLLSDLYNTERFRENLRMFYRGEYTFP
jgi:hypothetical protein